MARVPRHFHFIFGLRPQTEPFHVVYYLCLESCLRVNRPERLTLYYLHEPHGPWWERIRDRIERVRVDLSPALDESAYGVSWERHYRYAHHADFIRLEKLIEHGGVYADIDFLFLRPLPDAWFETGGCGLGRERPVPQAGGGPPAESLCNAVILAEAGSPFLRRWRAEMPAAFDGSWSRHSCELAHRLAKEFPDEVRVWPEDLFYPFMWTPEDMRALLEERREMPAGALGVHLWNHVWWEGDKRHFSSCNGERLTARYIRGGTTTYTRAARVFLPPRLEAGRALALRADAVDLAREVWAGRHAVRAWLGWGVGRIIRYLTARATRRGAAAADASGR